MAEEVRILRKTVEDANVKLQRQSNELLGTIVNRAVGFGYPNAEELQLGVNTRLQGADFRAERRTGLLPEFRTYG